MSKKHRKKHKESLEHIGKEVEKVEKDVKRMEKDIKLFAKFEGLVAEIIIILIIGIAVGAVTGYWLGTLNAPQATLEQEETIDMAAFSANLEGYLNDVFIPLVTADDVTASVKGLEEIKPGFFEVAVEIKDASGQILYDGLAHATKEKLFWGQVFDLNAEASEPVEEPSGEYTKSDVPDVKLFIMSFCPYGLQAVKAFAEPIKLLSEEADTQLDFVIYSNYASGGGANWEDYCFDEEEKYCSMHGINELNEDIRQMCIQKHEPDKLWAYLGELVKDYDAGQVSSSNIEDKWKGYAETAGVNIATIETCFSEEGETLLAEQSALNAQYGVRGSPTAFINDVQYSGSRTAEGFKQAICASFSEAPEDCGTELSSDQGGASGSC